MENIFENIKSIVDSKKQGRKDKIRNKVTEAFNSTLKSSPAYTNTPTVYAVNIFYGTIDMMIDHKEYSLGNLGVSY